METLPLKKYLTILVDRFCWRNTEEHGPLILLPEIRRNRPGWKHRFYDCARFSTTPGGYQGIKRSCLGAVRMRFRLPWSLESRTRENRPGSRNRSRRLSLALRVSWKVSGCHKGLFKFTVRRKWFWLQITTRLLDISESKVWRLTRNCPKSRPQARYCTRMPSIMFLEWLETVCKYPRWFLKFSEHFSSEFQ